MLPSVLISVVHFVSRKDLMRQPEKTFEINLVLIMKNYGRCAKNTVPQEVTENYYPLMQINRSDNSVHVK